MSFEFTLNSCLVLIIVTRLVKRALFFRESFSLFFITFLK